MRLAQAGDINQVCVSLYCWRHPGLRDTINTSYWSNVGAGQGHHTVVYVIE